MNVENIIIWEKYIVLALYVLVAVLSIIRFPVLKTSLLRFFPLLVISNLIIDGGGYLLTFIVDNNVLLYNLYNLPYFIFIFALFREASSSNQNRKIMRLFQGLILLAFVIVFSQMNIFYINHYPVVVFGNVLSIITIILYFIEILESDRVILIKYDTLFWISLGLLLFLTGATPIEIIRNIFEYESTLFQSLGIINYMLIIIMNICFIVGLLVTKPKLSQ